MVNEAPGSRPNSAEASPGIVAAARLLAWFSILYNLGEALACGWFGAKDNSLSLLGFGSDSLMEAATAGVVLWRFRAEAAGSTSESHQEHQAQRLIAILLMALGVLLAAGALGEWLRGMAPKSGFAGLIISLVSLAVMFGLYLKKRKVAESLQSPVLKGDAFATLSCMWLSGLLLAGSLLFTTTRLALFDGVTSLAMAALIAHEGWEVWEESSCDCQP
jgi:divalent metal cation (Fe/Co/Zn/Cd) transporter